MIRSAILHTCRDNQCFMLNSDTLIIRLCTAGDITEVILHYDDPMIAQSFGKPYQWVGKTTVPELRRRTKQHVWWQFSVQPEYKRCAYFFELSDGTETVYLLEDGLYEAHELKLYGHKLPVFDFAWMNPADIMQVPTWAGSTCWYQIFPDRFHRGDDSLIKPPLTDWKKQHPGHSDYYGGDLSGITEKLPYLQELGITGIYLTPIFEGKSCHKYDTVDYLRIDPAFGDEETLRTLCTKAHSLGIRVMLDAVFNHCGRFFPKWEEVIERGPASPWWDWFMVNTWPFNKKEYFTTDKKFYSFHFAAFMPKLNTNNPAVREYIAQVCLHWIDTCGIDGLRFDVADEVSHALFKELRQKLKARKPDVFLLGEIWHDSMPWLRGDELDSVMNYPFREAVLKFYAGQSDVERLCMELNASYLQYMQQTQQVLFNMLDSHDTERLYTVLHEDEAAYCQALGLLFAMPGSPCLFYGTELAMPGGSDPDCRRPMPWEDISQGCFMQTRRLVRSLTDIRAQNPCFTDGDFSLCSPAGFPQLLAVTRSLHGRTQGFVMNAGDTRAAFAPELLGPGTKILFAHNADEQYIKAKGFYFYEI